MTTTKTTRHPGKFEGCDSQKKGEELYTILNEGGCSEEIGDVESFGYYGLFKYTSKKWYILSEDSQGFFEYVSGTPALIGRKWAALAADWESLNEENPY